MSGKFKRADVDGEPQNTDDSKAIDAIRLRGREARALYEQKVGLYRDFASDIARMFERCLTEKDIHVHSITAREKDPDNFERKACKVAEEDPTAPKYSDPMNEITDKAAVRVTTYFLDTVDQVSQVINSEFEVIERVDKASDEPDRLGYQSIHYLVKHLPSRTSLGDLTACRSAA